MKQQTKDKSTRDELFTGGDWETTDFSEDGLCIRSHIDKYDETWVCRINQEMSASLIPHVRKEAEANAALIAQAPAMYRALNDVIDVLGEQLTEDAKENESIIEMLAAVQKALQNAKP